MFSGGPDFVLITCYYYCHCHYLVPIHWCPPSRFPVIKCVAHILLSPFGISLICLLNLSDKVFGPTCSNLMVYEDGAKDVALSVLTGINGTVCLHKILVFLDVFSMV